MPEQTMTTVIRRNLHALRAESRRTPTPVLLTLARACSFRLENDAAARRLPLGAWLGRYAISSGPCFPPSESLCLYRQLPTEANMKATNRVCTYRQAVSGYS